MPRSKIWNDEQFIQAVQNSKSIAQVIQSLGLRLAGANYKTVKVTVKRLGLSTSHFTGQGHLKNKTHNWGKKLPLSDILIKDSTYTSTSSLKARLIKENVLQNVCSVCFLPPVWNNQRLVMIIDHISGDNCDNRIENLRLVCPNCNSQLSTFAGRNKGKCG